MPNSKSIKKLKHHIVPHPHNRKRASLLRKRAIALYCLVLLTVFSFFKGAPTVVPGVLGYASNINIIDLLTYTNAQRELAGVESLKINDKLTQAAQNKAKHMFENNYWAHVAPDGTDPWSFIISADYDYVYAGENLAKNFNNSKDVVEAWYKSASHRENLLSEKYTDVGFAVVNGTLDGYKTTLVVQMFGKPRNAPAQIATKSTDNSVTPQLAQENQEIRLIRPLNTATQQVSQIATPQTTLETNPKNLADYVVSSPKIDVFTSTKIITLAFSLFMLGLFTLDVWYSKKHSIVKLTGHTLAHMIFLGFAVAVIFLSLQPGRLL